MKTTHSESNQRRTPEYTAWVNMIQRCENQNLRWYQRYGGRGISVCPEWRSSYEAFLRDMGRRPSPEHSVDRIDVDGNYEPRNCRWATSKEQQRNRSNSRTLAIDGVSKTLAEWSEVSGICLSTIAFRVASRRSSDEALAQAGSLVRPTVQCERHEYQGRMMSVSELVGLTGIPDVSMRRRLRRHGTAAAAIAAWDANGKGKKTRRLNHE